VLRKSMDRTWTWLPRANHEMRGRHGWGFVWRPPATGHVARGACRPPLIVLTRDSAYSLRVRLRPGASHFAAPSWPPPPSFEKSFVLRCEPCLLESVVYETPWQIFQTSASPFCTQARRRPCTWKLEPRRSTEPVLRSRTSNRPTRVGKPQVEVTPR
jgi:hypothetical protein